MIYKCLSNFEQSIVSRHLERCCIIFIIFCKWSVTSDEVIRQWTRPIFVQTIATHNMVWETGSGGLLRFFIGYAKEPTQNSTRLNLRGSAEWLRVPTRSCQYHTFGYAYIAPVPFLISLHVKNKGNSYATRTSCSQEWYIRFLDCSYRYLYSIITLYYIIWYYIHIIYIFNIPYRDIQECAECSACSVVDCSTVEVVVQPWTKVGL